MNTLKIEVKPVGKTWDEIEKEFDKKKVELRNSYATTSKVNDYLLKLHVEVAKNIGRPLKNLTALIDVLAPLSKKYAAKAAGDSVSSGGRSRATPEQVEKAKADLRAGKSVAEVAKDAGKSYGWAHTLKGSLEGKSKPKAKKKKA